MTREQAIKWLKDMLKNFDLPQEQYQTALDMAIKALEQEPYKVSEYDKDHIWYKGWQYISLRRFLEVKKALEQESRKITLEDVKEYCKPRYLTIISNELLYELTHPKIKALEQEPCEDAISRQAVLKIIDGWYENNRDIENIEDLIILITYMSSVNPQLKTGHWIYDNIANNWRCDKCGETPKTMGYVGTADFMSEHFRFCNHCGAKMIEPQESEEEE